MPETRVQSLGQEDLLEKEMATHSNILAWKTPKTVEPGRLQSMQLQRVRHDLATSLSLSLFSLFRVALVVKNPQVWSLGPEEPLGWEVTSLSSLLAWKTPWQATVHGAADYQTWLSDWTHIHTHIHTHTYLRNWNSTIISHSFSKGIELDPIQLNVKLLEYKKTEEEMRSASL